MHELAVCQDLIQQLEGLAVAHEAGEVSRVILSIGPLAGIENELLRSAFTIARAGTVADSAELDIEPEALRVRCRTCHEESDATPNRLICGHCGDWNTTLVSGDQMILKRVEMH